MASRRTQINTAVNPMVPEKAPPQITDVRHLYPVLPPVGRDAPTQADFDGWITACQAHPAYPYKDTKVCRVTELPVPRWRRQGKPRDHFSDAAALTRYHLEHLGWALGALVAEGTPMTPDAYMRLRSEVWALLNSQLNQIRVLDTPRGAKLQKSEKLKAEQATRKKARTSKGLRAPW